MFKSPLGQTGFFVPIEPSPSDPVGDHTNCGTQHANAVPQPGASRTPRHSNGPDPSNHPFHDDTRLSQHTFSTASSSTAGSQNDAMCQIANNKLKRNSSFPDLALDYSTVGSSTANRKSPLLQQEALVELSSVGGISPSSPLADFTQDYFSSSPNSVDHGCHTTAGNANDIHTSDDESDGFYEYFEVAGSPNDVNEDQTVTVEVDPSRVSGHQSSWDQTKHLTNSNSLSTLADHVNVHTSKASNEKNDGDADYSRHDTPQRLLLQQPKLPGAVNSGQHELLSSPKPNAVSNSNADRADVSMIIPGSLPIEWYKAPQEHESTPSTFQLPLHKGSSSLNLIANHATLKDGDLSTQSSSSSLGAVFKEFAAAAATSSEEAGPTSKSKSATEPFWETSVVISETKDKKKKNKSHKHHRCHHKHSGSSKASDSSNSSKPHHHHHNTSKRLKPTSSSTSTSSDASLSNSTNSPSLTDESSPSQLDQHCFSKQPVEPSSHGYITPSYSSSSTFLNPNLHTPSSLPALPSHISNVASSFTPNINLPVDLSFQEQLPGSPNSVLSFLNDYVADDRGSTESLSSNSATVDIVNELVLISQQHTPTLSSIPMSREGTSNSSYDKFLFERFESGKSDEEGGSQQNDKLMEGTISLPFLDTSDTGVYLALNNSSYSSGILGSELKSISTDSSQIPDSKAYSLSEVEHNGSHNHSFQSSHSPVSLSSATTSSSTKSQNVDIATFLAAQRLHASTVESILRVKAMTISSTALDKDQDDTANVDDLSQPLLTTTWSSLANKSNSTSSKSSMSPASPNEFNSEGDVNSLKSSKSATSSKYSKSSSSSKAVISTKSDRPRKSSSSSHSSSQTSSHSRRHHHKHCRHHKHHRSSSKDKDTQSTKGSQKIVHKPSSNDHPNVLNSSEKQLLLDHRDSAVFYPDLTYNDELGQGIGHNINHAHDHSHLENRDGGAHILFINPDFSYSGISFDEGITNSNSSIEHYGQPIQQQNHSKKIGEKEQKDTNSSGIMEYALGAETLSTTNGKANTVNKGSRFYPGSKRSATDSGNNSSLNKATSLLEHRNPNRKKSFEIIAYNKNRTGLTSIPSFATQTRRFEDAPVDYVSQPLVSDEISPTFSETRRYLKRWDSLDELMQNHPTNTLYYDAYQSEPEDDFEDFGTTEESKNAKVEGLNNALDSNIDDRESEATSFDGFGRVYEEHEYRQEIEYRKRLAATQTQELDLTDDDLENEQAAQLGNAITLQISRQSARLITNGSEVATIQPVLLQEGVQRNSTTSASTDSTITCATAGNLGQSTVRSDEVVDSQTPVGSLPENGPVQLGLKGSVTQTLNPETTKPKIKKSSSKQFPPLSSSSTKIKSPSRHASLLNRSRSTSLRKSQLNKPLPPLPPPTSVAPVTSKTIAKVVDVSVSDEHPREFLKTHTHHKKHHKSSKVPSVNSSSNSVSNPTRVFPLQCSPKPTTPIIATPLPIRKTLATLQSITSPSLTSLNDFSLPFQLQLSPQFAQAIIQARRKSQRSSLYVHQASLQSQTQPQSHRVSVLSTITTLSSSPVLELERELEIANGKGDSAKLSKLTSTRRKIGRKIRSSARFSPVQRRSGPAGANGANKPRPLSGGGVDKNAMLERSSKSKRVGMLSVIPASVFGYGNVEKEEEEEDLDGVSHEYITDSGVIMVSNANNNLHKKGSRRGIRPRKISVSGNNSNHKGSSIKIGNNTKISAIPSSSSHANNDTPGSLLGHDNAHDIPEKSYKSAPHPAGSLSLNRSLSWSSGPASNLASNGKREDTNAAEKVRKAMTQAGEPPSSASPLPRNVDMEGKNASLEGTATRSPDQMTESVTSLAVVTGSNVAGESRITPSAEMLSAAETKSRAPEGSQPPATATESIKTCSNPPSYSSDLPELDQVSSQPRLSESICGSSLVSAIQADRVLNPVTSKLSVDTAQNDSNCTPTTITANTTDTTFCTVADHNSILNLDSSTTPSPSSDSSSSDHSLGDLISEDSFSADSSQALPFSSSSPKTIKRTHIFRRLFGGGSSNNSNSSGTNNANASSQSSQGQHQQRAEDSNDKRGSTEATAGLRPSISSATSNSMTSTATTTTGSKGPPSASSFKGRKSTSSTNSSSSASSVSSSATATLNRNKHKSSNLLVETGTSEHDRERLGKSKSAERIQRGKQSIKLVSAASAPSAVLDSTIDNDNNSDDDDHFPDNQDDTSKPNTPKPSQANVSALFSFLLLFFHLLDSSSLLRANSKATCLFIFMIFVFFIFLHFKLFCHYVSYPESFFTIVRIHDTVPFLEDIILKHLELFSDWNFSTNFDKTYSKC